MKRPIQKEMGQVVSSVQMFLESRLNNEPIDVLNEIVRELRILLQQVITNHFLPLSLEQSRNFRAALTDQLSGACNRLKVESLPEDEEYHIYCIQEILACFEWAEQIKEEVPEDPITQKILAVDIPILRPFDYGHKYRKPVFRPKRR